MAGGDEVRGRHKEDGDGFKDGEVEKSATPSEEEFVIPSVDRKGHSVRLTCRMPPGFDRQIRTLVYSHRFPYRDVGDLVRHALMRQFRWLDTIAQVPSVLKEIEVINEISRTDAFLSSIANSLDTLGEQIKEHVGAGRTNEARYLYSTAKFRVENMPEGNWRRKYEKDLLDRWGHVLTGGKTGKLQAAKKEKDKGKGE